MYILKISNQAFVELNDDDCIIHKSPDDATTFATIGSAMKTASTLNTTFGSTIVKVISLC